MNWLTDPTTGVLTSCLSAIGVSFFSYRALKKTDIPNAPKITIKSKWKDSDFSEEDRQWLVFHGMRDLYRKGDMVLEDIIEGRCSCGYIDECEIHCGTVCHADEDPIMALDRKIAQTMTIPPAQLGSRENPYTVRRIDTMGPTYCVTCKRYSQDLHVHWWQDNGKFWILVS